MSTVFAVHERRQRANAQSLSAVVLLACISPTLGCKPSPEYEAAWEQELHGGKMCSRIATIGAPDIEGWAGVMLDNGTSVVMRHAVAGAKVCYKPANQIFPQAHDAVME